MAFARLDLAANAATKQINEVLEMEQTPFLKLDGTVRIIPADSSDREGIFIWRKKWRTQI